MGNTTHGDQPNQPIFPKHSSIETEPQDTVDGVTLSPQLLPGPVSPNFTQITCTHDGKPQYPSYFILLPFLFRLPRKPRKPSTLPAKTHRFVLSVVSDYARLRREPHYPRKKNRLSRAFRVFYHPSRCDTGFSGDLLPPQHNTAHQHCGWLAFFSTTAPAAGQNRYSE